MQFSEIYNIIFTEIPSFFPELLVYVGRKTKLLLYTKPTHALLFNTLSHTLKKTIIVKKVL
jgi:hypothetical protein